MTPSGRRTITAVIVFLLSAVILGFGAKIIEASDRVAVLISNNGTPFEETLSGFQEVLRKQGTRIDYDIYYLDGDASKAMQAIQKIKRNGASLLYAVGSLATDTAISEKVDIPIISGMVLRPEILKKAPNATGVILEYPLETQMKWLQLFLPEAKTVGVIYNPKDNLERIEAGVRIALKMGLTLQPQEIRIPQDLPAALDNLSKNADVLWAIPDSVVLNSQTAKHILLFSFRNHIPLIGLSEAWVKAGALYALDRDYHDLGAQCGEMALKVLEGAKAGTIPYASPRKVVYSVNLNTARQMKIRIPNELIHEAHKVF